jgi:Uncharacterized protein conserved in bacteria
MSAQFDHVSVIKKSNVYFGGLCISHTVQFEDGTKKTLGVLLPTEQALTFETHVPERMEIISGECRVQIADSEESELFRAGQSSTCQVIAVLKLKQMKSWIMCAT